VFARAVGSAAAPTAGLHVGEQTLAALAAQGVEVGYLTLQVGAGTFLPVRCSDLNEHPMHSEEFSITPALREQIAAARARGAPVVAVGTTVVRALESASDPGCPGQVRVCRESTRLLIQPGFRFGVVDGLLTNFHAPKSTLLALVSAFVGYERCLAAYRCALGLGYRFLSYGDAMWIPRRLSA
jgi:S-adenosylmethionine:tRNA ribosyltransferase-isomerase